MKPNPALSIPLTYKTHARRNLAFQSGKHASTPALLVYNYYLPVFNLSPPSTVAYASRTGAGVICKGVACAGWRIVMACRHT